MEMGVWGASNDLYSIALVAGIIGFFMGGDVSISIESNDHL